MRQLERKGLILLAASFAILAAGCSNLPDWTNPDTWGEPSEPATAASDSTAATDQNGSGTTVAEASDKYPVLADTPDKAPPTTSSDEQKQVANGLIADRTEAQYSGEQLRAGTEGSAAPPPPADASPATPASAEPDAGTSGASGGSTPTASVAAAGTVPATPLAAPAPVASVAPSNVRPSPPGQSAAAVSATDAALGFQPSHAPPLDPAVAQMIESPRQARLALAAAPGFVGSYGNPTGTVTLGERDALDPGGIAEVKSVASAFRATGGRGYVRIVGHASAAAPGKQVLERAQAGATVVARALIRLGVPAKRVLVEASSKADGEKRRADIFLQS